MEQTGNALVVADSKSFNDLVSDSIEKRTNLNVTQALNFSEARAAMERGDKTFDIALCDLMLPCCDEGNTVANLRG